MTWKKLFSREYSLIYCEVAALASAGFLSYYDLKERLILAEGKNIFFYCKQKELEKLKEIINKNKNNINKILDDFQKVGEEYIKKTKEYSRKLSSEEEIKNSFQKYFKIWIKYTAWVWTIYLISEYYQDPSYNLVKKKASGKEDLILKPKEKSKIYQFQEEISKLKNEHYSNTDLKKLEKKYSWIPCLDLHNQPWDKKDIEQFIREAKPLKEKTPLNLKAIFSDKELNLIDLTKRLAYFRDLRDDYRREGVFYIRRLFHAIAERMNLSLEDVSYLKSEDIFKEISPEVIKRRKQKFLLYVKDKKIIFKDERITNFLKEINFKEKLDRNSEIKGIVAQKGKVKGKVKIIEGIGDLKKVKEGDVLVAVTTHPDYLPAMNLAAVIITDEGGLTCHAAIVARESNKPCIVGTRIATKILKDGDLVEVDADKGVVKILKKDL